MLEIEDLHLRYGSVHALQGTSIRVGEGEIVGLVGHNGVGKSTLLKAITGLEKTSGGEIRYQGEAITPSRSAGVSRGIAYVPEDRRIFHSLSVGENLRLAASASLDSSEVSAGMDREMDRFPILRRYRDTGAGNLSGGEQQMLAISRALISKPRLLLLDEPTLGLAPKIINQIFDTVAALREEKVTILLVEQNVAKTIAIADRSYVMGPGGRIHFEGSARDLEQSRDFRLNYLRLAGETNGGGSGEMNSDTGMNGGAA